MREKRANTQANDEKPKKLFLPTKIKGNLRLSEKRIVLLNDKLVLFYWALVS